MIISKHWQNLCKQRCEQVLEADKIMYARVENNGGRQRNLDQVRKDSSLNHGVGWSWRDVNRFCVYF